MKAMPNDTFMIADASAGLLGPRLPENIKKKATSRTSGRSSNSLM